MYKICTKCESTKDVINFGKDNRTKDGLKVWCKSCRSESNKTHSVKYKERRKELGKTYYQENREKIAQQAKERRQINSERENKRSREWYANNKGEELRKHRREYDKMRRNSDPQFKIAHNLRVRINKAMKNQQKSGSAIRDLGCSISEFIDYLSKRFLPGMSLNNYGQWPIDHIKPLSSFDLNKREEFKKACYYTNLQPLWAIDNRIKHAKIGDYNACRN